ARRRGAAASLLRLRRRLPLRLELARHARSGPALGGVDRAAGGAASRRYARRHGSADETSLRAAGAKRRIPGARGPALAAGPPARRCRDRRVGEGARAERRAAPQVRARPQALSRVPPPLPGGARGAAPRAERAAPA